jgi:hypothetical protein
MLLLFVIREMQINEVLGVLLTNIQCIYIRGSSRISHQVPLKNVQILPTMFVRASPCNSCFLYSISLGKYHFFILFAVVNPAISMFRDRRLPSLSFMNQ